MPIKNTTSTNQSEPVVDPIDAAKAAEEARLEEERRKFTGKVRIIRTGR